MARKKADIVLYTAAERKIREGKAGKIKRLLKSVGTNKMPLDPTKPKNKAERYQTKLAKDRSTEAKGFAKGGQAARSAARLRRLNLDTFHSRETVRRTRKK